MPDDDLERFAREEAATPPTPPTPPPHRQDLRPEPWFYRFPERYAELFRVLGIILCVLVFGGYAVLTLVLSVERPVVLLWLPVLVLGFLLSVVWVNLVAALVLLAVDAARNLRAMRQKMEQR
jgi:hypothetical protein